MNNLEFVYQRIRLVVVMQDDSVYKFIMEANSHIDTDWQYDRDNQDNLTVYNNNGVRIVFNTSAYKFFYTLPKLNVRDKSTLRINEVDKNTFEVNDFVEAK